MWFIISSSVLRIGVGERMQGGYGKKTGKLVFNFFKQSYKRFVEATPSKDGTTRSVPGLAVGYHKRGTRTMPVGPCRKGESVFI